MLEGSRGRGEGGEGKRREGVKESIEVKAGASSKSPPSSLERDHN
jgi:hypothetical protein